MVDGNISNFASTTISEDSEMCDNNTCNGTYLGLISKVEIRCNASYDDNNNCVDLKLRPYYNGVTPGSDITHTPASSPLWSSWYNVPGDASGYPVWTWSKVKNLDFSIRTDFCRDPFTLNCSKVELRITYTSNNVSVITNPYPANGSTGISITPILSIDVFDQDGDNMTVTWRSNSSESWQIFATNTTDDNETCYQVFSNASINGEWWYWNVTAYDGNINTTSDIFSFYTGYQSKIHNTGTTNISGYLLIRIDYFNDTSNQWVIDTVVINETTPRYIDAGETLALDQIFNPNNVSTNDLNSGSGTYRVLAALQDPTGNILIKTIQPVTTSEQTIYLEDTYEFTLTET